MRRDRLLRLNAYRLALRHAGLTSPEAVPHARRDQLAALHHHEGEIVRLVREGRPDVMSAPFAPHEPMDWQVASVGSSQHQRMLASSYSLDDPASERRLWRARRAALRSG